MSNKHHKKLKELQRLQTLHQEAAQSAPTADFSHITSASSEHRPAPVSTPETTAAMIASDSHSTVKRDLVTLIPLLIGMVVLLFAFKWAVENTALTQWILSAGRLFN